MQLISLFKTFHRFFFLSSNLSTCSFICHPKPHLQYSPARAGDMLFHYVFCSACFCILVYLFSVPKTEHPTVSTTTLTSPSESASNLPGSTKPYVPSSTNCDPFFSLIPTTLGLGHSYDNQLMLSCSTSLPNRQLPKDRYVLLILAFPLESSTQHASVHIF